jgi:hypothetical protein
VEDEIEHYLDPVVNGSDMGIMSEAGLPGIADPGAKLVALAHRKQIRIIPLPGPSSIILALIASGLNGQNFSFNGYLPVKPAERAESLKTLEKKAQEGYAQIFMETPYRNQRMVESILRHAGETRLCIDGYHARRGYKNHDGIGMKRIFRHKCHHAILSFSDPRIIFCHNFDLVNYYRPGRYLLTVTTNPYAMKGGRMKTAFAPFLSTSGLH